MSTEVMEPVTEGTAYTVRLRNRGPGVVLVVVAWVPNHGGTVPKPQVQPVATGAVGELTGTVPSSNDARRMVVVASLDPDEEADLELRADGKLLASRHISKTTEWRMLVETALRAPAPGEAGG